MGGNGDGEDEELRRIWQRKAAALMSERGGAGAGGGGREPGAGRVAGAEAAPDRPLTLTDATLIPTVKRHPLVVVDCWAPWCGPCKMVAPAIEELARDYAGRIVFGKLDVDQNPATAQGFGIMNIPTLLVFRDGELAGRQVGAMPRRMLEAALMKYLGKPGGEGGREDDD
jgi:thioredoxin 1